MADYTKPGVGLMNIKPKPVPVQYIIDKDNVTSVESSGVTKPSNRDFRNAWVLNSDKDVITEDLATAKTIFKNKTIPKPYTTVISR